MDTDACKFASEVREKQKREECGIREKNKKKQRISSDLASVDKYRSRFRFEPAKNVLACEIRECVYSKKHIPSAMPYTNGVSINRQ